MHVYASLTDLYIVDAKVHLWLTSHFTVFLLFYGSVYYLIELYYVTTVYFFRHGWLITIKEPC